MICGCSTGADPSRPGPGARAAPTGTYCLGTENAVAAFANGLDYARRCPELLGSPTLVEIPAKGERRLHYASAIVTMGSDLIDNGIDRVEAEGGSLLIGGGKASQSLPISADFELSRRVCRDINGGF